MLAAFVRLIRRPAAGSHQNTLGGIGLVADGHGVGIDDRRAAVDHSAAGILEQPLVYPVQPRDFLVLVLDQGAPVMRPTVQPNPAASSKSS